MLSRRDARQSQVREILDSASQRGRESQVPTTVAVEIHLHITGPIVVVGAEAISSMMPVIMKLVDLTKQPIS